MNVTVTADADRWLKEAKRKGIAKETLDTLVFKALDLCDPSMQIVGIPQLEKALENLFNMGKAK